MRRIDEHRRGSWLGSALRAVRGPLGIGPSRKYLIGPRWNATSGRVLNADAVQRRPEVAVHLSVPAVSLENRLLSTLIRVKRPAVVLTATVLLATTACKREERSFGVATPASARADGVRVSELQPGPHTPPPALPSDYEENAHALNEGKVLYNAFNCVGCHAHGGGGIGPALMDAKWRYGSQPTQVFASIMEGRPNGMPTFRGKLSPNQAWQIAAYVRSLSGLVPKDAAPSRDDHMKSNPPPNSVDPKKPIREKEP
jgi:cytochrome c oxidase cbb3-type subunit III